MNQLAAIRKSPDLMSHEELASEVQYLRGELYLDGLQNEVSRIMQAFRVTPNGARLCLALFRAKGGVVSRLRLYEAMVHQGDGALDPEKMTDVYICRVRKAFPAGSIQTAWGVGYSLSPVGLAVVGAALGQERAA